VKQSEVKKVKIVKTVESEKEHPSQAFNPLAF